MELTEELAEINRQVEHLLLEDMVLNKAAYWILSVICLFFFFIAVYKLIRRRWNSVFLVLLCLSTFFWSVTSLLALYTEIPGADDILNYLRYIGLIPIPALLTLHIRLQVSYKVLRPYIIVLFLIIPVFLIFIVLRDVFFPQVLSILPAYSKTLVYSFVFIIYATIAIIKSYLLCFNVFYQMPPRARRSTRFTFASVITVTLLLVLYALWVIRGDIYIPQSLTVSLLLPLITPLALVIFIYPLFDSMYIMPASDVIVTSREFIMRGLNTTILVLNRRHQILDWNKKDWDTGFPLPKPMYKEPYPTYLKRVKDQYTGKVSPHNPDIVILTKDGNESHFLLRAHEIGNKQRMFGYVVEVSEVTQLYTKLRYFEEIAHVDTLTGLNNRNAYIDYTQQLIAEENMPLLILVGDLNKLKFVNDVSGHIAGDEMIKTVAKVIDEVKPENAFIARVGGDEFVLLVPNGTMEMATDFISRSNEKCGTIVNLKFVKPSVSWGYALMTSTSQSYNDVFAEADKMMYEYKKSRVEFSSSGILPEGE